MTKPLSSVERFPHLLIFPEWSSTGLFAHHKFPDPGLACIDLDGLPEWLVNRFRFMMSWLEQGFDAIVYKQGFFDHAAFNAYALSLAFDLKRVLGDKAVVYRNCEREAPELQSVVETLPLTGQEPTGSLPPLRSEVTHFYVDSSATASALWGSKDDSHYQAYNYEALPIWLADRLRYVAAWRKNESHPLLHRNGNFDSEGFESYRTSVAVDLKHLLGSTAVVWRNTVGPQADWTPLEVVPFLPECCDF